MSYDKKIVLLFPGGFKPPHMGHATIVNHYAANKNVYKIIVLVSPKSRDGINALDSLKIWKLLPVNSKVEIIESKSNSPVADAFDYVFSLPPDSKEIVGLIGSNKDDIKRSANFAKQVNDYKHKATKNGKLIPAGVIPIEANYTNPLTYKNRSDEFNNNPISSSILRKDVAENNYNNFITNYPGVNSNIIINIFNILKKSIDMNINKKEKFKKIIKEMLKEDNNGFLNAITGSEQDYQKALNLINTRAKTLQKAASDAIRNLNT